MPSQNLRLSDLQPMLLESSWPLCLCASVAPPLFTRQTSMGSGVPQPMPPDCELIQPSLRTPTAPPWVVLFPPWRFNIARHIRVNSRASHSAVFPTFTSSFHPSGAPHDFQPELDCPTR